MLSMKQHLSMIAGIALAAGVATILAQTAAADDDSYVSYSGTATTQHTGQFLYHENHVLQYRDGKMTGRVVLYTCRDGTAFARKTVSYIDPLSPDFLLEDASNGMREGIRAASVAREVFFRSDRGAAEKSSALPQVTGLVADTGFDAFVRANWDSLLAGHAVGMHFLVPSRLAELGFNVQHIGSARAEGVAMEVFRLKVSGVIGWVAPSIDVSYSAVDRTLVRYVGLSDLRDPSNSNFQADIVFRPADRAVGDEQTMLNARRARLALCK